MKKSQFLNEIYDLLTDKAKEHTDKHSFLTLIERNLEELELEPVNTSNILTEPKFKILEDEIN